VLAALDAAGQSGGLPDLERGAPHPRDSRGAGVRDAVPTPGARAGRGSGRTGPSPAAPGS
jgi:hypothetical protein